MVCGCLSLLRIEWTLIERVAVGDHSSVVRAPAAKAGGPEFNSHGVAVLGFFLFLLAHSNVWMG